MRRECPVEVLCVSSPVSPRLRLHCVSSLVSAMGGLASGRLLLARAVPVSWVARSLVWGYARACVRGMSAQAEWLVRCRPSLRRTPGDSWCLCPGRYFPGPPHCSSETPLSFWPMNMPEGAAGVRSPGKYSTRAGAGAFRRRGLWPVTVGGSIS